jgi:hypothetical protein
MAQRGVKLGDGAVQLLSSAGAAEVKLVGTGPASAVLKDGNDVVGVKLSGAHLQLNHVTVNTGTATIAPNHTVVLVTRTSTGACTLTLPPVASAGTHVYIVKDAGHNAFLRNITIVPDAGDTGTTIDGASSAVIMINSQSLHFVCDGADWNLV